MAVSLGLALGLPEVDAVDPKALGNTRVTRHHTRQACARTMG